MEGLYGDSVSARSIKGLAYIFTKNKKKGLAYICKNSLPSEAQILACPS